MVSLFHLDYVISYKRKPGRDLPALRDAYDRLLDHLETICGAVLRLDDSPRWSVLRKAAAMASRKSELGVIEDEIDAIFCAYLAWLWANEPTQMIVLGDYSTGYIVTPTPPRVDVASNRPPRRAVARRRDSTHEQRERLVAAFCAAMPHLTAEESQTLAKIAVDLAEWR